MNRQDDFMIIAHRGAAGEAPENTLAAFALGVKQGATGMELDVHLSKDGEIIVCHDTTLNRTTDRQGVISEMTVAEIKQADAGRWFHESFEGERIPLLEEVFDLVPPSVQINVEIKAGLVELVAPLVELLKRKDRAGSVFVSSFDFECLEQLNALAPDVRLALLYNIRMTHQHRMAGLVDCPVYSLHPHWSVLNKPNVQAATSRGLKVYPWTVNKEEGMRSMIDCGVSGIITDFPGRLKALLDS